MSSLTGASPRVFARRICWAAALVLAAVFAAYAAGIDYVVEREIWLLRATGWAAAGALLLALSMTPLQQLARFLDRPRLAPYLPALRRSLGIISACFGLGHGGISLSTYLWDSWPVMTNRPFFRAGLLTLIVLTALLATSFPRIVRLLGIRLWKPLHRLAYVAALLAFQHLILSPFAERRVVIGVFAVALAVNCLRFLGRRRGDSPNEPRPGTSPAHT